MIDLLMDDPSGSGSSDSSLEDLMGEHSSRPSVAPWIWCIEYIAKFKKDLHCILDLMNMGLECPIDLGKRTNEVVALRLLEFVFNPSKKNGDGISIASASGPRIEFDLSLSSIDVLKAILKEIPFAELGPGRSELSKFNVLPFIAHKNSCLPRCALERLRDVVLEENRTNAAPSIQASEPFLRDEQPMDIEEQLPQAGGEAVHIDREPMGMKDVENQRNAASFMEVSEPVIRDEQLRHVGEIPMHTGEEVTQINEQDKCSSVHSFQLRDVVLEAVHIDQEPMGMKDVENQRNAASFMEVSEPVIRDEQLRHVGEIPMHTGEEVTQINEQEKCSSVHSFQLRDVVLEENGTNAAPSIQASEPFLRNEQPMDIEEQLPQAGGEAVHIDQEPMGMKDVENQRNAASFMEASEPVLRDEQLRHEGEIPMHSGEEVIQLSEQDKVNDEQMQINHQDKVSIVNDDETLQIDEPAIIGVDEERENDDDVREATFEPTNNRNTDSSSGRRQDDVPVKCGKDGTWLIGSRKDVSATVHQECLNSSICPNGDRSNTSRELPSSSRTRQGIECVKCGKDGNLLICSTRNCSAMVHRVCLGGPVRLDENENFRCPKCWYHKVTSEYLEAKNSMQAAKKKLFKFQSKVSAINKRLGE